MPRKMKIEAGEIAELVRQHLAGEIGVNEAGVPSRIMRKFVYKSGRIKSAWGRILPLISEQQKTEQTSRAA